MQSEDAITSMVERARAGDKRSIARLISLVEDESDNLRAATAALMPFTGHAHVIGLTGSPGVGKSTTTAALIRAIRAQGMTVGVLAVDPSSPFTGGALLGDRIRMQDQAMDPHVYIRSLSSRGHLGGLSWSTPQALRVLDAAGFDIVLLETVGVGQSEVEIVGVADTVVVLLAPGMGDGIQAAKAGILEIGDIFAVNKADRDGARATSRELRHMVQMTPREPHEWVPPVLQTVASRDEGISELLEQIDNHRGHATDSGALDRRRQSRFRGEIESLVLERLRRKMGAVGPGGSIDALAKAVAGEGLNPYDAADRVLRELTGEVS